jgi:hypothetical protein
MSLDILCRRRSSEGSLEPQRASGRNITDKTFLPKKFPSGGIRSRVHNNLNCSDAA